MRIAPREPLTLHVKALGGTFVIDDFGRQRVQPRDLFNRWIIPLENRVDYLTLHTGKSLKRSSSSGLIVKCPQRHVGSEVDSHSTLFLSANAHARFTSRFFGFGVVIIIS